MFDKSGMKRSVMTNLENMLGGGGNLGDLMGELGISNKDMKAPQHIAADAKVEGKDAEIRYLLHSITGLSMRIEEMDKERKEETKALNETINRKDELLGEKNQIIQDRSSSLRKQVADHAGFVRGISAILTVSDKMTKKNILKSANKALEICSQRG